MSSDTPYIIAEIGVNWAIHDSPEQNFDEAKQLISAAKNAGADAAKFQTFSAAKLAGKGAPKAAYQQRNDDRDDSQYAMLKRLELPREWHASLKEYCEQVGIDFLSSAFSAEDATFLADEIQLDCIKIGSGELTNATTLLSAAQSGADIILSTGMASLDEIETALGVIAYGYLHPNTPPASSSDFAAACAAQEVQQKLQQKLTLLQCTSNYPCPLDDAHIRSMLQLQERFNLPVGFSDHTEGHHAAVAATALGASVIEKHFTLSKTAEGPDHKASLEPEEFTHFVQEIRNIHHTLGRKEKAPLTHEHDTARIVRQMLITTQAVAQGEKWNATMLTTQRVGKEGVAPIHLWDIAGNTATRDYAQGEIISGTELEGAP